MNKEIEIAAMLKELGMPCHLLGYKYTKAALAITIENDGTVPSVTKVLYPAIAKRYNTTASRVERSIRHAIEVTWDRGNVDVLNDFFGYTINPKSGKPTNSEFLATIAENIRLQELKEQ